MRIKYNLLDKDKKYISRMLLSVIIIVLLLLNLFSTLSFGATYNQTTINGNKNNRNGIDAFPESYRFLLNKLVETTGHTNWIFKPLYTDISWSELTSTTNENACLRNTIYKDGSNPSTWYCGCGQMGDTGYYCASGRIVNYYLDPRNSLTEKTIFQFLELSNSSSYTKAMVETVLKDSFMNYNVSGYDYAGDIMDAAVATGESPLSIAIKIIQEIGRGKNSDGSYYVPNIVSGNDSAYPGVYNFYNYGASDGNGNIVRGLEYAYKKGWTSISTAIIEGARLISNSYISVGQTTKYLFKFDVVGQQSSDLYWHQYMTNIQDPTNQASMLFSTYSNNDLLNESLTFLVPVYKDMPEFVKLPSSLTGSGGTLYYISSKSDPVAYRNGPGSGYTKLGSLAKDTLVEMVSYNVNNSGWSQIRIESGSLVYMTNEYLTAVNTIKDIYSVPYQPNPEDQSDNPNDNFKVINGNIVTEPQTTIDHLRNEGYTIISAIKNGENIGGSSLLPTGTIIETDRGTYTVIKLGDINGDGLINTGDSFRIKQQIMEVIQLDEVSKNAADINGDGLINTGDSFILKKEIMGISSITI